MVDSNPPQRVRSLAQDVMGEAEDGQVTFEEACLKTEGCVFEKLRTLVVVDKAGGAVGTLDLPLRELGGRASVKHLVDAIVEVPAHRLDKELVKTFMLAGNYGALPPPFGLKTPLEHPCCMQLAAAPDPITAAC